MSDATAHDDLFKPITQESDSWDNLDDLTPWRNLYGMYFSGFAVSVRPFPDSKFPEIRNEHLRIEGTPKEFRGFQPELSRRCLYELNRHPAVNAGVAYDARGCAHCACYLAQRIYPWLVPVKMSQDGHGRFVIWDCSKARAMAHVAMEKGYDNVRHNGYIIDPRAAERLLTQPETISLRHVGHVRRPHIAILYSARLWDGKDKPDFADLRLMDGTHGLHRSAVEGGPTGSFVLTTDQEVSCRVCSTGTLSAASAALRDHMDRLFDLYRDSFKVIQAAGHNVSNFPDSRLRELPFLQDRLGTVRDTL